MNERLCTIQNSRGHSSLLNEMECDDDAGIDVNRSPSANNSILIEARAVYNELKRLHYTLKGNHDGDSGINPNSSVLICARILDQNAWFVFI